MELITRKEAKELGLRFYFTGKKCRNGHLEERYSSNEHCKKCQVRHRENNYARYKKLWDANHEKHKERTSLCGKLRWQNNKEEEKLKGKIYRVNNKEKIKKKHDEWREANQQKCNYHSAHYRAVRLKATVGWADKLEIKKFYLECPTEMQVDHIIPLRGNNICGLHVEYNLQYLTKPENCSKGNKFEPLTIIKNQLI